MNPKIILRPICLVRWVTRSFPQILYGSVPTSGHTFKQDWPYKDGNIWRYPGKCMTCGLKDTTSWSDELLQPYDDPSYWKEGGKEFPTSKESPHE